jgi:hypothetical protein
MSSLCRTKAEPYECRWVSPCLYGILQLKSTTIRFSCESQNVHMLEGIPFLWPVCPWLVLLPPRVMFEPISVCVSFIALHACLLYFNLLATVVKDLCMFIVYRSVCLFGQTICYVERAAINLRLLSGGACLRARPVLGCYSGGAIRRPCKCPCWVPPPYRL